MWFVGAWRRGLGFRGYVVRGCVAQGRCGARCRRDVWTFGRAQVREATLSRCSARSLLTKDPIRARAVSSSLKRNPGGTKSWPVTM